MHDSAPIPPDPESERRGHELRDVAIRPILYFLIGLFVFGGLLQTIMSLIMNGYVAEDTKVGVPAVEIEAARKAQETVLDRGMRDTGVVGDNVHQGPTVALQRDTTADMLRMYAEDRAALTEYRVDPRTKQIRIPIRRALQIVAKKGLPHRDTPTTLIDPALPYPVRSEPYMATEQE
jgi:hypothetical protein